MTFTGTPTLASFDEWGGSEPLPVVKDGVLNAAMPAYTDTGEVSFRVLMKVPESGVVAETSVLSLTGAGTARRWELTVNTDGALKLYAYDGENAQILDSTYISFAINGDLISLSVALSQDGSDVDYRVQVNYYTDFKLVSENLPFLELSGTLSSYTMGAITRVIVNSQGGLGETSVGHLTIATDIDAYTGTAAAAAGWRGEDPLDRLERLVQDEEAIPLQITDDWSGDSKVTMGTQGLKDLVDLIRECGDTGLGILFEPRNEIGLAYRSRLSLYNQDPRLTLDYSEHQLAGPPTPVDDDRCTRNDVTVTRESGSFAKAVLENGTLSVLEPPDGVGRYDENVTISLGTDDQLPSQASWRLHLGTVDEARYPQIELNVRHSTFTSSQDMMDAALELDVGDRIVITNPPSWLPPDQINLLAVGFTETLGVLERDIVVNCIPESAYHVAYVEGDDYERADTDGSSLVSDVNSTATALSVATQAGSAVWITTTSHASDFPFDIRMGGEVMTVSAFTGTSSPQTFTVTRSVNGVVKPHSAGPDIRLTHPSTISL
ncbi:hypothetical protein [Streptomyces sp. enrichment culture]|uniref:hypothetical protein n=1 Tax=Streptomyces sp. enrichment culture TaxID=1795815 RepID=UPI003F576E05